jgi:hypothetical protein
MKKIRLLAIAGLFVLSAAHANFIREKFTTDPALDGWQIYGDTNLFQWNSANQVLDVTWDSSQTNSYFYHPLGATFTKADGFCVLFDLNLTNTDVTGYFELAIGLCNFADSTSADFSRANGYSPNLCEFDFFPGGPDSYGPSVDATLIDASDNFYFAFDTNDLPNNVTYRVVLVHQPGASTINCQLFTNGQPFRVLGDIYGAITDDFQLDTLAVCNYTTTDDIYGDSLFAQGTVGNLTFASPLPVGAINTAAAGQVQFASDTNWLYQLEQSGDFQNWSPAAPPVLGNGTNLVLQATNPPPDQTFYRVRADLP